LFFTYGDDMEKANCAKFISSEEKENRPQQRKPQGQSSARPSQLNSIPPEFALIRNNNSFQQQLQEQVQSPQRHTQTSSRSVQQIQTNDNTKLVKNTNNNKNVRRDK
jgi:hypothetical protein